MIEDYSLKHLFSFLSEKTVSGVPDSPVNLWEEGRAEDELSPEEIQMVWQTRQHSSIFMSSFMYIWINHGCFMNMWLYLCQLNAVELYFCYICSTPL